VALAANGPTDALLVLIAVIAVQQIEGNLLQPLIMGKALSLHPAVVLVVVTAGTLTGGIAGALVAVPLTAVVHRFLRTFYTFDPVQEDPMADNERPDNGGSLATTKQEERTDGRQSIVVRLQSPDREDA
jgi:predicted PurR-regulated permease PerM